MEIRDNEFQRQFETTLPDNVVLSIEYSLQERKLFLTRINTPEGFEDEESVTQFKRDISYSRRKTFTCCTGTP